MTSKRAVRRVGLAVALGVLLLALGFLLFGPREATAKVDAGPVGERIVARAVVVPSAGVTHVYAVADGQVLHVFAREGDVVESGHALADLEVAGHSQQLLAGARGVVLARHVEVGDYALAAAHGAPAPLFELADPTQTELRVEVEEADAASLALGQSVAISTVGFRARASGRVVRVSAQLERRLIGADDARVRADGMVRVATVSWAGERPNWPLGVRATAVIEVRRRAAATRVPRSALSVRDGRTIVERAGRLWSHALPVEVLSADEAYAEIRGVALGTEVVTHAAVSGEAAAHVDSARSVR